MCSLDTLTSGTTNPPSQKRATHQAAPASCPHCPASTRPGLTPYRAPGPFNTQLLIILFFAQRVSKQAHHTPVSQQTPNIPSVDHTHATCISANPQCQSFSKPLDEVMHADPGKTLQRGPTTTIRSLPLANFRGPRCKTPLGAPSLSRLRGLCLDLTLDDRAGLEPPRESRGLR